MPLPSDDSLMERFDRYGLRRFRARDGIVAMLIAGVLLALFEGPSIRRAGEQMGAGPGRTLVLAVGRPAASISTALGLARVTHDATGWLSPDAKLVASSGFGAPVGSAAQVPPVTPAAFDPASLGQPPPAKRRLRTLLVTGDSMSTPLDADVARLMAGKPVKVIRDPHLGAGISKSFLVDWGQLSTTQARRDKPDAVVLFIGANEGFPLPGPNRRQVKCCGADWAALYADRARQMTATYRRRGATKVYWITLPTPRNAARARISRVVNAAIQVAVQPWRADVRVIDTVPIFTPRGYRDAMPVDGSQTIVRASDGIHLNEAGASLLAGQVVRRLAGDFTF